jgi:hypothetical protein
LRIDRVRKNLSPETGLTPDAIEPCCQIRPCGKIELGFVSNATPHQRIFANDGFATSQDKIHCTEAGASKDSTIIGTASMYDPFQPGYAEGGVETASGELYDSVAWTAAIQTGLRDIFGGICYGRDYRPAYALVEAAGKRAVYPVASSTSMKGQCAFSIRRFSAESSAVSGSRRCQVTAGCPDHQWMTHKKPDSMMTK